MTTEEAIAAEATEMPPPFAGGNEPPLEQQIEYAKKVISEYEETMSLLRAVNERLREQIANMVGANTELSLRLERERNVTKALQEHGHAHEH